MVFNKSLVKGVKHICIYENGLIGLSNADSYNNINPLEEISVKPKLTFTLWPISLILIWKELQIFDRLDYGVMLKNTRLYTTKTSSDTYTSQNMPAAKYINSY